MPNCGLQLSKICLEIASGTALASLPSANGAPAPNCSPMAAATALVIPVRPSGGARVVAARRCGRTRRRVWGGAVRINVL